MKTNAADPIVVETYERLRELRDGKWGPVSPAQLALLNEMTMRIGPFAAISRAALATQPAPRTQRRRARSRAGR